MENFDGLKPIEFVTCGVGIDVEALDDAAGTYSFIFSEISKSDSTLSC